MTTITNTPIGADVLLRNADTTLTTESTCVAKGMSWTPNTDGGDLCLSPCPVGYTSAWDKVHGAVCNKDGTKSDTNELYSLTTGDDELVARQKLLQQAQKAQQNTDVFTKAPPASGKAQPTDVLLDIGGVQITTTTAALLAIALIYWQTSGKAK